MMVISQLRIMRTLIAEGVKPFVAYEKSGCGERATILLEATFTPATSSAHRSTERWMKDPSEANGIAALRANLVPGSERQLWQTIERMQTWEVCAALDRAILKAK